MKDYYDIINWREKPTKFFTNLQKKNDGEKLKMESVNGIQVDIPRLYALFKSKILPKPNGIYTMVMQGMPLDNMIYWDYVLESDKGFIHVWRTTLMVEAHYYFDGETFDLEKFITYNLGKYREDIDKTISTFEKHTIYTNHYKSYKQCVEFLWKEISKLNLTVPKSPKGHFGTKAEFNLYTADLERFTNESVKFHTLGKSLLLNAAFEIESYLNLVIRVGASQELRKYPDILKKHLGNNFGDKLNSLKYHSIILKEDVDKNNQVIKDALELMTIRNKYVHSDESSSLNKIGEEYWDDYFPLRNTTDESPTIEVYKQIYHRPDYSTVRKSYYTTIKFILYIESLFKDEHKEALTGLLENNPIGFNEKKNVYSGISTPALIEFFLPMKDEE